MENVQTKFIGDLSAEENPPGFQYSFYGSAAVMFRDRSHSSIKFAVVERLSLGNKQGLGLSAVTRNMSQNVFSHSKLQFVGYGMEAEDPRIVAVDNNLFIIFSILDRGNRRIAFSRFETWSPVLFEVENGAPPRLVEKNWIPFN